MKKKSLTQRRKGAKTQGEAINAGEFWKRLLWAFERGYFGRSREELRAFFKCGLLEGKTTLGLNPDAVFTVLQKACLPMSMQDAGVELKRQKYWLGSDVSHFRTGGPLFLVWAVLVNGHPQEKGLLRITGTLRPTLAIAKDLLKQIDEESRTNAMWLFSSVTRLIQEKPDMSLFDFRELLMQEIPAPCGLYLKFLKDQARPHRDLEKLKQIWGAHKPAYGKVGKSKNSR